MQNLMFRNENANVHRRVKAPHIAPDAQPLMHVTQDAFATVVFRELNGSSSSTGPSPSQSLAEKGVVFFITHYAGVSVPATDKTYELLAAQRISQMWNNPGILDAVSPEFKLSFSLSLSAQWALGENKSLQLSRYLQLGLLVSPT